MVLRRDAALTGLKMYWVQLGLNFAWTPLFFLWKKAGRSQQSV
jgi:tryptophan-rich sensory protein